MALKIYYKICSFDVHRDFFFKFLKPFSWKAILPKIENRLIGGYQPDSKLTEQGKKVGQIFLSCLFIFKVKNG